ncbi:MAG: translation initiation factor IF-3 [Kiritimatiellae bacterium]|nr:translation initiation factor IF-3 [Kiritimatiellia bacterium]
MAFPQDRQEQNGRKTNSFVRTNYKIRVPEVRVVDSTGKMLGIMQTRKAQALAEAQGLDLVEITPNAQPPVCKLMDYGKFRYEESLKQKQARKNAKATQVKEIKFHAATDVGDVTRKVKEILGFIDQGNKVRVSLMFRGRENAHRELGQEMIDNVIALCGEKVQVEQVPKLMGRTLSCMLAPKSVKGGKKATASEPPAVPRQAPGLSPTRS